MTVVHVKDGARFDLMTPAAVRILAGIDAAANSAGVDLTITSGTDSHPPGDVHTLGLAYDVSVRDLTPDTILLVRHFLQMFLGTGFTVLYEVPEPPAHPGLRVIAFVNAAATAAHVHVQLRNGFTYPPALTGRSSSTGGSVV